MKQTYVTNDVTADIEAGSVEGRVNELIASHDVIMFSKTNCPFCLGNIPIGDLGVIDCYVISFFRNEKNFSR
jgi:hypothetical protein